MCDPCDIGYNLINFVYGPGYDFTGANEPFSDVLIFKLTVFTKLNPNIK